MWTDRSYAVGEEVSTDILAQRAPFLCSSILGNTFFLNASLRGFVRSGASDHLKHHPMEKGIHGLNVCDWVQLSLA